MIAPLSRTIGERVSKLFGVGEELALRLERIHSELDVSAFRVRQVGWSVAAFGFGALVSLAAGFPPLLALLFVLGAPEAVLDLAFHTTRAQLPTAQLVYNDYMSWEPQHAAHCADVLRLLEGFRRRNVPVDALGIQSHIEMLSLDPATGVGPYREREWRQFLDEVVAMGYKLLITEFDVKDKALPGDIATRDARIADYARRYFEVMLDYDELGDILRGCDLEPLLARLARAQDLAGTTQAQILLGNTESVIGFAHQRQARPPGLAQRRSAQQDAAARPRAPPDPAAQLVELGKPEALRTLDDDQGRIGHIDADLDHRRRNQHAGLAAGE